MAYPTTIDDFTNPIASDPLNSPSHSTQHININNAVEALEAKVGADSSAVTSSHDYKIAQLESGKEDKLNFTPEDVSNKQTNLTASATKYPTVNAVNTGLATKQDTLEYTPENSANKENTTINTSTTKYPTVNLLKTVKDVADAKMSNPMSATGDIIYGGASGVATRLAKGDDGQILELESGLPAWKTKGVTPINAQTGSYTLVLSDAGKLITLTSSSAITLTIPTNASVPFPIGTQVDVVQMGDGEVTIAGATINSKGGNKIIADKFVGVSLIKTGTDTWLLVGDLK